MPESPFRTFASSCRSKERSDAVDTAVFAWLAAVLLISVLASILPALSATRISVRESLAYA